MALLAHLTMFDFPAVTMAFAAGVAAGFALAWRLVRR